MSIDLQGHITIQVVAPPSVFFNVHVKVSPSAGKERPECWGIGVPEFWSNDKRIDVFFFDTPILHHSKAETFKNSWQPLNYLFMGSNYENFKSWAPKVRLESKFPYLDALPRGILCLVDISYNFQHFSQIFRSEDVTDIAQGAAEYTGNAFDLDHKSTIAR